MKHVPLPLWQRLSDSLSRDITAGRIAPGDRLPPERQLAQELGCSVGTLRKALARLEDAGQVERVQGSGTYVRGPGQPVYDLFRLELVQGGGAPSADLLDARLTKAPDAAKWCQSDNAHRFRRLRKLSGTQVAVEEIWVDEAALPALDYAALSESLYVSFADSGLRITQVEDRVSLGSAPDWAPPGVLDGPCLLIERLGHSTRPVEYSRTWVNPARAGFVSRREVTQ